MLAVDVQMSASFILINTAMFLCIHHSRARMFLQTSGSIPAQLYIKL
jgi:hypothetical protein